MTDSYLEWQECEDMNPSWVLTLVTPGRDPIMLVCFDKPIEVRGSHEPSEQPQYRKWPGEPPHCMSCSCGMTDEQKRTVPEADYLRIHKELMDLKYPQQGASRDASSEEAPYGRCEHCGGAKVQHPSARGEGKVIHICRACDY